MAEILTEKSIFAKLFVPRLEVTLFQTKSSPKPHGYSAQAMPEEGIQSFIFYV